MYGVYYDDELCQTKNQTATDKYGKVPKEWYHMYSGNCEIYFKNVNTSSISMCDNVGLHTRAYADQHCGEPAKDKWHGVYDYNWGECTQVPNTPNWVILMNDGAQTQEDATLF